MRTRSVPVPDGFNLKSIGSDSGAAGVVKAASAVKCDFWREAPDIGVSAGYIGRAARVENGTHHF